MKIMVELELGHTLVTHSLARVSETQIRQKCMKINFSSRTLLALPNQQKFKLSLFPQKKPFGRVHSFVTNQSLLVSTIVSTDAHFADFYDIFHVCVGFSDQGGSADGDGENVFVGG